jgi:hypothetical protein
MNELLQQLGELALGAIPTLILFITLVLAYRYILYGRLMETRAEREERTAGALEKSRQAIGQADVRSQEYEAKLRAGGRRSSGAGSSASSSGTPSGKPLWSPPGKWPSSVSRPRRLPWRRRAWMPAGRSRLPPAS